MRDGDNLLHHDSVYLCHTLCSAKFPAKFFALAPRFGKFAFALNNLCLQFLKLSVILSRALSAHFIGAEPQFF